MRLLGLSRSGVYRQRAANDDEDLALMRRIDELFLRHPFLGSRRIAVLLSSEAAPVNRKRVQRLMRRMGIAAIGPKTNTTKPAPGHKIFPYLLRELTIDRANQVWAADITYIPIGRGFLYLVAIIDWASRAVLSWRLSNTLEYALLHRRPRGGVGALRQTGHLQYGSRLAVHLDRLHRPARRCRHPDLDGRARPLDGQRVHRAAVALTQVRGHLFEGLRRRP